MRNKQVQHDQGAAAAARLENMLRMFIGGPGFLYYYVAKEEPSSVVEEP